MSLTMKRFALTIMLLFAAAAILPPALAGGSPLKPDRS